MTRVLTCGSRLQSKAVLAELSGRIADLVGPKGPGQPGRCAGVLCYFTLRLSCVPYHASVGKEGTRRCWLDPNPPFRHMQNGSERGVVLWVWAAAKRVLAELAGRIADLVGPEGPGQHGSCAVTSLHLLCTL